MERKFDLIGGSEGDNRLGAYQRIEQVCHLSRELTRHFQTQSLDLLEDRPLKPDDDAQDSEHHIYQNYSEQIGEERNKLEITYPSIFRRGAIMIICSEIEQTLSDYNRTPKNRLGRKNKNGKDPVWAQLTAELVGWDFVDSNPAAQKYKILAKLRNNLVHGPPTDPEHRDKLFSEFEEELGLLDEEWFPRFNLTDEFVQQAGTIAEDFLRSIFCNLPRRY